VLAAVAVGLPAPAAAAPPTYSVPITIDSTGTTDVTTQLSQFLSSVPDGATVSFRPLGRYRVDGTLLLRSRHNLGLEGNGATVFATTTGAPTRAHMAFSGGGPVSVRDLTIVGANNSSDWRNGYVPSREWQAGIQLTGVHGASISHVTIERVWGDFLYLGQAEDGTHQWTDNVTLSDSTLDVAGRQGIAITGARDVTITSTSLSRVALAAFDIEPNNSTDGAARIHIAANSVGPAKEFFAAAGAAAPITDLEITANHLHGLPLQIVVAPPAPSRRSGVTIAGNTSDTASSPPVVSLTRVDGASVHDNQAPIDPRSRVPAVKLRQSCDVDVGPNQFPGAVRVTDTDGWLCHAAPTAAAPAVVSGMAGHEWRSAASRAAPPARNADGGGSTPPGSVGAAPALPPAARADPRQSRTLQALVATSLLVGVAASGARARQRLRTV